MKNIIKSIVILGLITSSTVYAAKPVKKKANTSLVLLSTGLVTIGLAGLALSGGKKPKSP